MTRKCQVIHNTAKKINRWKIKLEINKSKSHTKENKEKIKLKHSTSSVSYTVYDNTIHYVQRNKTINSIWQWLHGYEYERLGKKKKFVEFPVEVSIQ